MIIERHVRCIIVIVSFSFLFFLVINPNCVSEKMK